MNLGAALIKDFIRLGRLRIMVPVSLTGFTGYFVYDPMITASIILVTAGIMLLGISASALNQVQEADTDAKMERTRERPIPSGSITKLQAIVFSGITMLAGTLLILTDGNVTAAITGIFTILVYNGIYTPLKRVTTFAVIPGALTGALPPIIGWTAAGGSIFAKPALFIGFLFFLGQVPHFWLLVLKYGEQYRSAGIPSLADVFSSRRIGRLTFLWTVTVAAEAIFLCLFGIIDSKIIIAVLVAASVILLLIFSQLLKTSEFRPDIRRYSVVLNSYFLLMMILIITDRII